MSFNISEKLIAGLRDLHTEIVDVIYESETYIDPIGRVFEDMPSFVRVVLVSKPGAGSYIRHELWLPDGWNGCFLGLGNGGMAGTIHYGTLANRTRERYAVINTDMGTSRGRDSGVNNPDLIKDFGWRATYLMTKAGKLITEEYYGSPIEKSYFFGTSTGGQQSMMLAQRFPEEYDGISAGVPANNRTNLHMSGLWILNAFRNGNVSGTRKVGRCPF
ncbi:MAG: tannase/feruloyl esterase family alpha/beta hydrolase [Clostridia bacterium]|nr:tannase/feruloyl esterase family alpha/beta hydrolase [Clostridia bacterium]